MQNERPTFAKWSEIQRSADNAVDGCVVHCVRSIVGWMRELYTAPEWGPQHAALWESYNKALRAELTPARFT